MTRNYVLLPRFIPPGLDSAIIGTGEPRWNTVGTKKKNPISDGRVLHSLHSRDIGPIAVDVAQPDLLRVLAKINVDVENPRSRGERRRRRRKWSG